MEPAKEQIGSIVMGGINGVMVADAEGGSEEAPTADEDENASAGKDGGGCRKEGVKDREQGR